MKRHHVWHPRTQVCRRCGMGFDHYMDGHGQQRLWCRFSFIPRRPKLKPAPSMSRERP